MRWCVLVVLAACGGPSSTPAEPGTAPVTAPDAPAPPPQAAPTADAAPLPAEAPAGPPFGRDPVEVTHEGAHATVLDVRTGRHEGHDRVVVELADAVPGFRVAYAPAATHCGSGEPVKVLGGAVLEIRLKGAQGHDEAGHFTFAPRSRTTPDLAVVKQVEATCDFEGDVTLAVGVDHGRPFRAFELADPPRLVVDLKHTD